MDLSRNIGYGLYSYQMQILDLFEKKDITTATMLLYFKSVKIAWNVELSIVSKNNKLGLKTYKEGVLV